MYVVQKAELLTVNIGEYSGPEGWQFNQDGTELHHPLTGNPSCEATNWPTGAEEQLAGGVNVVVNGPRLVHVTAVVTGSTDHEEGMGKTAVTVVGPVDLIDMVYSPPEISRRTGRKRSV